MCFIISFINFFIGIKLFLNLVAFITSAYSLEHHKTRQQNSCAKTVSQYLICKIIQLVWGFIEQWTWIIVLVNDWEWHNYFMLWRRKLPSATAGPEPGWPSLEGRRRRSPPRLPQSEGVPRGRVEWWAGLGWQPGGIACLRGRCWLFRLSSSFSSSGGFRVVTLHCRNATVYQHCY